MSFLSGCQLYEVYKLPVFPGLRRTTYHVASRPSVRQFEVRKRAVFSAIPLHLVLVRLHRLISFVVPHDNLSYFGFCLHIMPPSFMKCIPTPSDRSPSAQAKYMQGRRYITLEGMRLKAHNLQSRGLMAMYELSPSLRVKPTGTSI